MNAHFPWLKYLLIFIFLGLLATFVFQALTPKEEKMALPPSSMVKTAPDGEKTSFNNIVFEGELEATPSQLGLYQATVSNSGTQNILNSIKKTLIEQFQLKKTYSNDKTSVYVGEKYSMYVSHNINHINFSHNQFEGSSNPKLTTAKETSQQFLQNIFELELLPINNRSRYLGGELRLHPVARIEAKVVEIPYAPIIEQLPVYYYQETDAFVTLMIDGDNRIQKALFQPVAYQQELIEQQKVLELEEILTNINQHHIGSLIKTVEENPEPLDLTEIKQGVLTQAYLEYRIDPDLELIYPCYRFEGNFLDRNDQRFDGTLITPAIKTQTNL